MTHHITGIERPLRSIEEFVFTLRSATHRFVDVFFDGWKTTILYAFGGAAAGILYTNELRTLVAALVILAAISTGIVLAVVRSDKKRLAVVLFVVRLFIGFSFMTACSPHDSKPTALQELWNAQQTNQRNRPLPLQIRLLDSPFTRKENHDTTHY